MFMLYMYNYSSFKEPAILSIDLLISFVCSYFLARFASYTNVGIYNVVLAQGLKALCLVVEIVTGTYFI